jgi:hypothetical protein
MKLLTSFLAIQFCWMVHAWFEMQNVWWSILGEALCFTIAMFSAADVLISLRAVKQLRKGSK